MMALDFRKWHANEMKHRPRRARTRWWLAASMLILALLPVLEMIYPGEPGTVPNTMPFVLPAIIGSMQSPFMRDTNFTDRGLAQYDEFERAALAAAMRRAYLTTILLMAGLFIWLVAGEYRGWPLPDSPRQWFAIGFAMVMAMLVLPTTFAEFMVPMPDTEDELR